MEHRADRDTYSTRIRATRVSLAALEDDPRDSAPQPQPALATQRTTGRPRTLGETTGAHRAVSPMAAIPVPTPPRLRRTTQARRIRPGDTALAETAAQMLAAKPVSVSTGRTMIPVMPDESAALDDLADPFPTDEPATIIHATVTHTALLPITAPHRAQPPSRVKLGLLWSVAALCIAGVTLAAVPLVTHPTQPLATSPVLPRLTSGQYTPPTGPWSTGAGVAELGLGGGAPPGVKAPGSAGAPVSKQAQSNATSHANQSGPSGSAVQSAPLRPWPPSNPFMYVPGHPAFGVSGSGGFYSWAFGQCTWWAQYKKQNENLTHMGNARYWAAGAAGRGYRTGGAPTAGSTVVFQPGVQGAGGEGHVAHVEAVYPGGWFLMSEMNFYINGGGWGRVDYRFAHSGWGVTFIY
jgi:surface antigen